MTNANNEEKPKVTLNAGISFSAAPTISILDAALAHGVVLEYSCRTGRCGVCKTPLLEGKTALLRPEESLSEGDAAAGLILTCCRAATSNVMLNVEPLTKLADIVIRTMPSRIVSLELLAPDVIKVVLKTPPSSKMRFLAGQYVDVLAAGVRRSYSLANAPRPDGLLELLIKRYRGGILSDYWFERAKAEDLIRLEGPFGTFFLREDSATHLLFLATGTGIAPIKALLEELASDPAMAAKHSIRVFWGNRQAEDFCWTPGGLSLNLAFHHLLSGSDPQWSGARGYVHEAALREGVDTTDTAVYACGSDAMIASARQTLSGLGFPLTRFFSDAFVSSN